MIYIKSDSEIEKMREACKIVGLCHKTVKENIKAGMSTMDIEKIVVDVIKSHGAIPSFKGVEGMDGAIPYPYATCVSINDEIIHGMPNKNRIIYDGDIVSVDIGAYKNGFHGDSAKTYMVGNVSETAKKLVEITKQCFYEGIRFAKVGYRLSDISHAIQKYAEANGFSVVREFQGHGIGRSLHEEPGIPNYGKPGRGPRLEKGMTLAIEPMINEGDYDIDILEDNWGIVTYDGKLSAHYEHTILITNNEPELLTKV